MKDIPTKSTASSIKSINIYDMYESCTIHVRKKVCICVHYKNQACLLITSDVDPCPSLAFQSLIRRGCDFFNLPNDVMQFFFQAPGFWFSQQEWTTATSNSPPRKDLIIFRFEDLVVVNCWPSLSS